jgi:hypothetical protein
MWSDEEEKTAENDSVITVDPEYQNVHISLFFKSFSCHSKSIDVVFSNIEIPIAIALLR